VVAVTQAEVIGRRRAVAIMAGRAVAIAADQAVANPIPLAIPRDRDAAAEHRGRLLAGVGSLQRRRQPAESCPHVSRTHPYCVLLGATMPDCLYIRRSFSI
jgi:hypothetical protein